MLGAQLPEYHVFQRAVTRIVLDPNALLFDVGVTDRRFFFVVDGVIGASIVQVPGGPEWIRRFAGPGELISGVPALGHPVARAMAGPPPIGHSTSESSKTQYRARAFTRADLRAVDAAVFWALAARHHEWTTLAVLGALASSAAHEKRERELLTLSAEERFRVLMAERPQLIGRIPQKDLARYIGVTPVAMSRIVSRIRLGQRATQPVEGMPLPFGAALTNPDTAATAS